MYLFHVSIWAILISAVAAFAIGAIWYSPLLLGKQWMKAHGHTPENMAQLQADAPKAYAVSFVTYLVMAFALGVLIHWIGAEGWHEGLHVGAICWFGFAATIGLTANMYSDKPLSAYFIDAGYQLVYLLVMGAVLGAWNQAGH